jgi:hypothetical protein
MDNKSFLGHKYSYNIYSLLMIFSYFNINLNRLKKDRKLIVLRFHWTILRWLQALVIAIFAYGTHKVDNVLRSLIKMVRQ